MEETIAETIVSFDQMSAKIMKLHQHKAPEIPMNSYKTFYRRATKPCTIQKIPEKLDKDCKEKNWT